MELKALENFQEGMMKSEIAMNTGFGKLETNGKT